MSSEKGDKDRKADTSEPKRDMPEKELTPQELQKRKKMLMFPLMFLLFIGSMWLIFAPSGDKDEQQPDGFNPELPIPKDEGIVGDKRTAYEQEAVRNRQEEKKRSLQDFAFMLGEEGKPQPANVPPIPSDNPREQNHQGSYRSSPTIQLSTHAYRDINRQLSSWNDEPTTTAKRQAQTEMESRIQELEKQLGEKSQADQQLDLIEKSYAIAAKYMPKTQEQKTVQVQKTEIREKVITQPVSQVHHNAVSLLSAPMGDAELMEQYSKPSNRFITATGQETVMNKNSIKACVHQTVTLSDGKELQLRLLEPMMAGDILIPRNTVLTGSAKISGERLQITISSIQYADNVIPVEMAVHDMDGMQGILVPNSDGATAVKEIAANMGTSMGSGITITDDAGSQLAADLGRSAIQGVSQFFSKKMREVKVTLKSGYKVLLLPKAQ